MKENFPECLALVLQHEGGFVNHPHSLRDVLEGEAAKRQVSRYVPKNARAYNCEHDGCENAACAKGLCNAHYIRHRNGADMNAPIKHRTANKICSECDRLVDGKGGWGLCKSHYRRRRRAAIKGYFVAKMGGRCSSCLGVFPLAAFDFHHLGDKDHSVADLIESGSAETIESEMAKCALLCANCHRIEHNEG